MISDFSHNFLEASLTVHVMNAKTICPTAEVQRTPVGQPALLQRGSAAALPLLVEHSQISGPGGLTGS
jgi:hypothetical protein